MNQARVAMRECAHLLIEAAIRQFDQAETPVIEYGHVETASRLPGGAKGMGEGGAIASPAALANAINDALAPLGVHLASQPMSPSAIVTAIMASDDARDHHHEEVLREWLG